MNHMTQQQIDEQRRMTRLSEMTLHPGDIIGATVTPMGAWLTVVEATGHGFTVVGASVPVERGLAEFARDRVLTQVVTVKRDELDRLYHQHMEAQS